MKTILEALLTENQVKPGDVDFDCSTEVIPNPLV